MPELPEVETIVRGLRRKILGKRLRRFFVFDKAKISQPRLKFPLKIFSVERHGKYIVCEASGGEKCLIHLRMTGELLFGTETEKSAAGEKQKHERARFHFHDGSVLRFVDVRRFGTINWLHAGKQLPQLGVEPLSKNFDARKLASLLRGKKTAIKSALLDQRLIAGIGNIYADESLWAARIRPKRRSNSLKTPEIRHLVIAIRNILRQAIKKGGSTLRDYKRVDGSSGGFQDLHRVYGREGEKCFRCGDRIKRIKIGSRSSYFCPVCQRQKF